ncbi:sulfurtransferase [Paramagnetospirillum kuznetsovii]|uniref:Sulfurtransferase n=1 Tax=Paramagnetospirillum kuznetsovii TaxID=2053833 RepID=A0A364P0K6_9PROT|nr:rhodanese-like domain-containing protein [Paramagnetospirillum kuznetsovii]RAU22854.1 sulfurtransferase [Paramagnetospirillum kuznetsovii]
MMRFLLAALFAMMLSLPALAESALTNVDNTALQALMGRGVPVVDIRTPGEWSQTGTIAGSHRIMAFDERGKLAPDFLEKLASVAKPGDEVALICRSGNRTAVISKALTDQLGYRHVYNVEKGMNRWLGEGRPVEK